MRTEEVKALVLTVLDSIKQPYSHHIIDEVFCEIEKDPKLMSKYERLCDVLSKDVVNNWGGHWVAIHLGKTGEQQVPSKLSSIIGSYSILDTDEIVPRTENDAKKLMSDYYLENKQNLPVGIQKHRDLIIAFLLQGMSPQEAFCAALDQDSSLGNVK